MVLMRYLLAALMKLMSTMMVSFLAASRNKRRLSPGKDMQVHQEKGHGDIQDSLELNFFMCQVVFTNACKFSHC